MTRILNLPHPRWFVPYVPIMLKENLGGLSHKGKCCQHVAQVLLEAWGGCGPQKAMFLNTLQNKDFKLCEVKSLLLKQLDQLNATHSFQQAEDKFFPRPSGLALLTMFANLVHLIHIHQSLRYFSKQGFKTWPGPSRTQIWKTVNWPWKKCSKMEALKYDS
jgi:hypothetical protein